jgi:glyoxylase-like metal-dependent hydrolase (beta-lactamase superfamily II)
MSVKRVKLKSFPGGPGRTTIPETFNSLMTGLEERVFGRLTDATWIYPGHGNDSTLRRGAPAPRGMARSRLVRGERVKLRVELCSRAGTRA